MLTIRLWCVQGSMSIVPRQFRQHIFSTVKSWWPLRIFWGMMLTQDSEKIETAANRSRQMNIADSGSALVGYVAAALKVRQTLWILLLPQTNACFCFARTAGILSVYLYVRGLVCIMWIDWRNSKAWIRLLSDEFDCGHAFLLWSQCIRVGAPTFGTKSHQTTSLWGRYETRCDASLWAGNVSGFFAFLSLLLRISS